METDVEIVSRLKWFHAIDFGDYASAGRFPEGTPQNFTLFPTFEFLKSIDLFGASLLDIGTFDGLVAFGATKLGAKRVVGIDSFDQETFRVARRLLSLEERVEYQPGKQIRDLKSNFEPKSFDVIVCAGVIYHMLYPMQAFVVPRLFVKDGGYLLIETPFIADSDEAKLVFNGVEERFPEPYSYFIPTRSALIGMANLSGFAVKAVRTLTSPKRITLLLKAVSRDELIEDDSVAAFIKQMLKRDTCDDEFRFRDFEKIAAAPTRLRPEVDIEFEANFNPKTQIPTFPYHPPLHRPKAGTTRWETLKGNTEVL